MKKRILYLGNKLAARGFTPTGIDTLGEKLEEAGYELRYASSKSYKAWRLLDLIGAVFKSRNWADYVLIDTYSTQNFWFAYCGARLCSFFKLKYITILHGGNLPARLQNSKKASEFIFNTSFVNCSPSVYLKEAFLKAGFKNIKIIPNSIDLENYPFNNLKIGSAPKLLWVRSFAAIYNPMLAVKLVEALQPIYPDISLLMVGPDKDGSLQRCEKYSVKKNLPITFTGKLSKSEWIERSQTYKVFLNTTHYDNFPVSVLEAMALGLVVISTNVGGISYLIEDKKTGILVESDNLSQLIDAVKYTVDNPQISTAIALNARSYAAQYDWEHVKKEWHDILN